MKTLFAGPFIGEFGWELFNWQGYIRKMAENYDRVIVSSRKNRKILYEDFCDEFVPYEVDVNNCAGWTCYGHKYNGKIHCKYNPTDFIYVDNEGDAFEVLNDKEQKFVSYGNKKESFDYDIIIHARMIIHRDSFKTLRNWSKDNWNKLIKKYLNDGYKVASIGLSGSAEYIDGTIDLMDKDLKETSDILSNSRIIVGPSSGPMHFATLCKCPQLLWCSNQPGIGQGYKEIYQKKYNPFNIKSIVYDEEGWDPPYEKIYELTKNHLEGEQGS